MQKPLNCYYLSVLLIAFLALESFFQQQFALGCFYAALSLAVAGLSFFDKSFISQYCHNKVMQLFEKI